MGPTNRRLSENYPKMLFLKFRRSRSNLGPLEFPLIEPVLVLAGEDHRRTAGRGAMRSTAGGVFGISPGAPA